MVFAKPTVQEKTLKILVYGEPKTGKSHFVYTATEVGPVLWQDTEHGSDYYDPEHGHGFRVAYDKTPATGLEAIRSVNGKDQKVRQIVAIDSFSSVWFGQQEVAEQLTAQWGGKSDRATFRAWGPAKKPLKELYDAIMLSRCHCIITARAKQLYAVSRSGEPELLGIGPDVERNLSYAVDIVLRMGHDEKGFFAIVEGSRSPKLQTGQRINDPKFADLLVAMQPGKAPIQVEDDIHTQVEGAPMTWPELQAWLKEQGWNVEEARMVMKEKFGSAYKAELTGEYIKAVRDFYESAKAA